jgi:hypothetical protein
MPHRLNNTNKGEEKSNGRKKNWPAAPLSAWNISCFIPVMSRIVSLIALLFLLLAGGAEAAQLQRISRLDNHDLVRIYLRFDQLPAFSGVSSDRRIDILLPDTGLDPAATLFPPDRHIVKILPRDEGRTFILSLFFRYPPQRYTLTASGTEQLVLEILPGNEFSKAHRELAERLKGLSLLDRPSVELRNPTRVSPYAANWLSFFIGFESPITLRPKVRFTPLPFPLVRLLPPAAEGNLALFSPRVLAMAAVGDWDQVAAEIVQAAQAAVDPEQKKLLVFSHGEVLGRQGKVTEAVNQLSEIKERYRHELLGSFADFLLLQLQTSHGDPFLAGAAYGQLEQVIDSRNPLAPYLLLARVETALATGNHSLLNELLQRDDLALPPEVAEALQVRQADYWFAIDQPIKAYAAYRLLADNTTLAVCPASRHGFCSTLYTMKEFAQAAECYQRLAALTTEPDQRGLALYRQYLAESRQGWQQFDNASFSRLAATYGSSETGLLSALKRTDLDYLRQSARPERIRESYREIAEAAEGSRHIREEALFKEALVLARAGEEGQAIALAGELLREFGSGPVRISAQALLIQLLPQEIRRLVSAGEYFAALVLVKRHDDLFQEGWIDRSLLLEIAAAYHRLGIYEEAQRLYLYILEISPPAEREQHYLPLVTAAFEQGEYLLVDDYAAQYHFLYPQGDNREAILLYRLEALRATGLVAEALRLLPSPLPPDQSFRHLAASLYFRNDSYHETRRLLEELEQSGPLSALEQFMLAESLYQTEAFAEAEKLFAALDDGHPFAEKGLFRQAQLAKRSGKMAEALSLWRKIVETGNNPLWKELAERELQYATLSRKL